MIASLSDRLDTISPKQFYAITLSFALILSLFFFSPSFNRWDLTTPGHFETARGTSFLLQLEDPFRRDIEATMHWRFFFPVILSFFGTSVFYALTLPWIGLLIHLFLVAYLVKKHKNSQSKAFFVTLLTAGFASTWITTGFLGLFIIFPILSLTCISYLRSTALLFVIGLITPWMSEYYLIGLPVALCVRALFFKEQKLFIRGLASVLPGVLLYLAIRGYVTFTYPSFDGPGIHYVLSRLRGSFWYFPYAPFAWWFAYRLGWVYLYRGVKAFTQAPWRQMYRAICFASILLTTISATILGSAMTANIMLLFPLFLLGVLITEDSFHEKYLGLIAALNFILPAAYVDYVKFGIKSPLIIELGRLLN